MRGRLLLTLLCSLWAVALQNSTSVVPAFVIAWPAAASTNEALTTFLVHGTEAAGIGNGRQVVVEAFLRRVTVPESTCEVKSKRGAEKASRSLIFLVALRDASELAKLKAAALQANTTLANKCISWTSDVEKLAAVSVNDLGTAIPFLPPYKKSVRRDDNDEDSEEGVVAHGMEIGPQLLMDAGAAAMVKGDSAAAERLMKRTCELLPKSALARTRLAMLYGAGGRPEEMMETLEEAVALDPRDLLTRDRLAAELFSRGRLHDALKHALEAQRVRPTGAAQMVAVARIRQALGETYEAWRGFNASVWQLGQAPAFKGVVRGDREDLVTQARAFAGLGHVAAERHADPATALAWLSRAIGLHPFQPDHHRAVVQLLLRRRVFPSLDLIHIHTKGLPSS